MIKLIAEIGSNHNNDLKRCFKLIDEAKRLGFYGVKFQLFKADKLTKDKNKVKEYRKQELNEKWIKKISEYCRKLDIKFGCTPFYLEAVDILKNYVDFFKISSFDILRDDLIQRCIDTKKTIFISLGLAEENDIKKILNMNFDKTQDLILMHCISKYPCKIQDVKLGRIKKIYSYIFNSNLVARNIYVGYSDHSKSIDVIIEAINQYATFLELHFDLNDRLGSETKYGHCWTIDDIEKLYNRMNFLNMILDEDFILSEDDLKLRANKYTGYRDE